MTVRVNESLCVPNEVLITLVAQHDCGKKEYLHHFLDSVIAPGLACARGVVQGPGEQVTEHRTEACRDMGQNWYMCSKDVLRTRETLSWGGDEDSLSTVLLTYVRRGWGGYWQWGIVVDKARGRRCSLSMDLRLQLRVLEWHIGFWRRVHCTMSVAIVRE